MCGRATLTVLTYEELAEALGVRVDPALAGGYRPRYNIAPTDEHWIVRGGEEGSRELSRARWGLVNSWARDARRASQQINARVETVDTSRAYKSAFVNRRCIVPVDGFYEWTGSANRRQPLWFRRADGELLLLAGIYEDRKIDAPGNSRAADETSSGTPAFNRSFSILTMPATGVSATVHDRMPVLLSPSDFDLWLRDPGPWAVPVAERIARLRVPDEILIASEASRKVNKAGYDAPDCLEPDGTDPGGQRRLF